MKQKQQEQNTTPRLLLMTNCSRGHWNAAAGTPLMETRLQMKKRPPLKEIRLQLEEGTLLLNDLSCCSKSHGCEEGRLEMEIQRQRLKLRRLQTNGRRLKLKERRPQLETSYLQLKERRERLIKLHLKRRLQLEMRRLQATETGPL